MVISLRSISFVGLLSCFLLFAVTAEASSVVRSGESVSIAGDQIIEGDFYTVASKIHISGTVEEDLVAAGGQITVNGSVAEDAFLVGGRVDIHGTVGDDLRILAGEVTVAGPVMGDLLVLGGAVHILSTASISGDVLLYAGDVKLEGSVGGDVIGSVKNLRLDSVISGDVDITVGQLTLGDRAMVSGDVRYVSDNLVIQAPNATVSGNLLRNDPILPGVSPNVYVTLIPVLILLFSALVWHLVSRRTLRPVVERTLTRSFRPLVFGLITVFFVPFAIAVLLVSMLGVLVGGALLAGYLLLIILSIIALPAVIGQLLSIAFSQPTMRPTLLTIVVGATTVALLMLLPIIGQALLFGFMVITIGAMMDIIIRPTMEMESESLE
jgi:cytoskeletal protein CcmA (bactofilin family)